MTTKWPALLRKAASYWLSILMFLGVTAALAQDVTPPSVPDTPVYRVLVIGDALAGGLGSGLGRIVENDPHFETAFRVNESSGLTRPEIYDWAQSLPNILEGKNYTAVVVMIGSNDRRDIQNGDKLLSFGSAEWKKMYSRNVDGLLQTLKTSGVDIYWASMPPMADPQYDADLKLVSSLQQAEVEAAGGSFVDLHTPLLGADGAYSDSGLDDTGTMRRLRARDGVNFYKQGNNRLGQILLGAIKAQQADQNFEDTQQTEGASAAVPEFPIFGQSGDRGEDVVIEASVVAEIAKSAGKAVDTEEGSDAAASQQPAIAKPLSNAERLFTQGLAPLPERGRFDDFSYVLPAE